METNIEDLFWIKEIREIRIFLRRKEKQVKEKGKTSQRES